MTETDSLTRKLCAGTGHRQHGVALVIVLWMLLLLTAIASNITFTSRTEIQAMGNLVALARAEAAADAGVHRAIADLLAPAGDPSRWRGNGSTYRWEFSDATLHVTIRDEAAKVDLNHAPAILLAGLFRAVGETNEQALALADAVVDWRDPDELRSLHGAERAEYAAAGKPYAPANSPFETVEELQQVLGMDDALFRRVRMLVTVYSQLGTIDASVAARPVLLALPSATPALVDDHIMRRGLLLERGLPAPPFPLAPPTNPTTFYSILAEAELGDNIRFSREAVVRLTGNALNPFIILAWRDVSSSTDTILASDSTNPNGHPR